MPVKGEIPVIEQDYDLTSADGAVSTGKGVISGVLGISMLFAIVAAARTLYNRASEEVDTVNEIEVF